jgi:hypothetical protein
MKKIEYPKFGTFFFSTEIGRWYIDRLWGKTPGLRLPTEEVL